ncbi:MAG: MlaD family protein [Spirochaeta sp.]|nr:MlaD family protein [Spirochaeta sp.]
MSRYIKIGLFVTVTTVLLIGYMLRTADTVGGSGGSYTVHAYMEDASGLVVDSAVRLAGVQVGRLTDIQLDENRARLTIELQDDVQIAEDSIISKQTSSMLGTATVAINPGNGQGAMLQDGDVVRNVRQQAALSDVMVNANDLAAEATSFVTELNRYLAEEGTMDALDEIVDVVRQTTLSASQLIEENLLLVRASMQNVEEFTGRVNQDSIRQIMTLQEILDNTASLTARLDQLVGDNDESLTRSIRGIEENLTELRAVLASVQTSADNVAEVTQIVRDGDSTVGKLLTNDEFYERVDRIAGKTEEFIDSTIGLGIQVGFQSDYLIEQNSARSTFDLRLSPGEKDKYYSIGVTSTPVPTEMETRTETVTTQSGTTTTRIEEENVRTDELKFNAQLARTWGPLTVRGGVIENTGGVGVDLRPIDQFAVSAEAFDFGAEDGVYLRSTGTIYPFHDPDSTNPVNWIFINGGIDDIMGVYERDFFVGAGVRFTDQDLRGLVGFIPVN